jgi:hypothetical protein
MALDHDRPIQRQRPDKLIGHAVLIYLEITDETGRAPDLYAYAAMFGALSGEVIERIQSALEARGRERSAARPIKRS